MAALFSAWNLWPTAYFCISNKKRIESAQMAISGRNREYVMPAQNKKTFKSIFDFNQTDDLDVLVFIRNYINNQCKVGIRWWFEKIAHQNKLRFIVIFCCLEATKSTTITKNQRLTFCVCEETREERPNNVCVYATNDDYTFYLVFFPNKMYSFADIDADTVLKSVIGVVVRANSVAFFIPLLLSISFLFSTKLKWKRKL